MNLAGSRRNHERGGGVLKNTVFLMLYPEFWSRFLCIEQVSNEKKILGILMKQNINRKIARLLT